VYRDTQGGEALIFLEVRDGKARFSFEGTSNTTRKFTKAKCEQLLEERRKQNLPYKEVQKALDEFASSSPSK